MKTSIIFLGLVALSFTNANAANEFKLQDLSQQETATLNVAGAQQESQLAATNLDSLSVAFVNSGSDTAVFDPNTVVKTNYVKTAEQVIIENRLITESQEETAQPLTIAATLDKIAEDNQIIESEVASQIFTLDFEKINHTVKSIKANNTAIITSDLKL